MEFRWIALLTLWTMLSGPVFVGLTTPPSPASAETVAASVPKEDSGPAK